MLTKTQITEYTIPISEFLYSRLYGDAKPHCHHIANLQKGLILVYRGAELVGEGTGFGVPVVRYRDRDYFSGSSTLHVFQKGDCTIAVKEFALNRILENRFRKGKMENKIIRKFTRLSNELYWKHRHWRLLALANLPKSIGVQTTFVQAKSIGNVTVTYFVDSALISVKVDLERLEKGGLQRIFLLNEQGSRFFKKYLDSNGTVLFDKQIGAWENVEADWAYISNKSDEVGFRLWKVKDTILHRGREFLKGTFDWVGLDYEVNPEKTRFEYNIEIFGSLKRK